MSKETNLNDVIRVMVDSHGAEAVKDAVFAAELSILKEDLAKMSDRAIKNLYYANEAVEEHGGKLPDTLLVQEVSYEFARRHL